MINYSIVNRTVNTNLLEINQAKARVAKAKQEGDTPDPNDVENANTPMQYRAYAVAQYADVMTIEKFAKHISDHGCVYSRADISAILYMTVDCIRELLLQGKKIRLGDLGDFSLNIQSKGADSADKFTAQLITGISVVWDCGQQFRNLLPDAEFNLVASRAAQAAVLKAIKSGETVVDLNAKNEDDDNNPGGGNGGSTPGGNGGSTTGTDSSNTDNTDQGTLYTLSISSADVSQGSVDTSVNKQYSAGSRVTIKATPASGYAFASWSDGSTVNPRNITLNQDITLTATFKTATVTPPGEDDDDSPFDGGM